MIDVATTFTTGITLIGFGTSLDGCPPITSVTIDPVAGLITTSFNSCQQQVPFTVPPTGLVDGTYFLLGTTVNGTLVVSGVTSPVPEPGTIALMLLGLGILFVMRKRVGHSRPAAV